MLDSVTAQREALQNNTLTKRSKKSLEFGYLFFGLIVLYVTVLAYRVLWYFAGAWDRIFHADIRCQIVAEKHQEHIVVLDSWLSYIQLCAC